MFAVRALSIAARRRGLLAGSPPPARAATPISRISLVNTLPRLASVAFLRASIDGPLPMGHSGVMQLRGGDFTPRLVPPCRFLALGGANLTGAARTGATQAKWPSRRKCAAC